MRRALAVLTALLLVGAGVAGYARAQLADREAFSARAVSALDREEVRTALATRLVDQVAQSVAPDVLVLRPLLVRAVAELARSSRFRRAVGTAAGAAHGQLLGGDSSYVVALNPSSPVVEGALRSVSPRVARAVPDDLRYEVFEISPNDSILGGARAIADLADWWWPLCAAALLAAAALAATARSARDAIATLGAVVLAAGLTVAAALTVLGLAVTQTDDDVRQASRRALWEAFAGDLRTTGILAALAGAVTVVAAGAAGGPDPLARAATALRPLARSDRPAARIARATALAGLGVALITSPELLAQLAAVAAGVVLVLLAARELWPEAAAGRPRPGRVRSGRLLAVAVGAPLAAAVVALVVVLPSPATTPAEGAQDTAACNGSVALCGRRLNEVVFPATHNSYSAADEPGWLFANQRHGIAQQLRDGIRAMLIDIHYGVPDPGRDLVRTDLKAEGSSRSKVARELGPVALRAADRLATRVGGPLQGERRPYLCHTLCELGAEPLVEQLRLIRDFLDRDPRETLILFVEPYVAVDVIERALRRRRAARPGGGAAPRRAAADARRAGRRRDAPGRPQRGGRRRTAVVPPRLLVRPGHAAGRPHRPRAALRALPRRRRQPALPHQPLDRHDPAAALAQRAHRRAGPARPPRPVRARARADPQHARRRLLRALRRRGAGGGAEPLGGSHVPLACVLRESHPAGDPALRHAALARGAEPPRPAGRRSPERRRAGTGVVRHRERTRPVPQHRPAWGDRNLREVAGQVESPLFIAHIRAATGTPVEQTNCHPFRHGRWLFAHNGFIDGYFDLRRDLLVAVDPEMFRGIEGTTDSELMFHLALGFGLDDEPLPALERMAGFVEETGRRHGVDEPLQMTVAVSDGERLYAARYASGPVVNSLFVSADASAVRAMYPDDERFAPFSDESRAVVSEPLGDLPGVWHEVPAGSALVVQAGEDEHVSFTPRSPSA